MPRFCIQLPAVQSFSLCGDRVQRKNAPQQSVQLSIHFIVTCLSLTVDLAYLLDAMHFQQGKTNVLERTYTSLT
jgi:hypothetical protein